MVLKWKNLLQTGISQKKLSLLWPGKGLAITYRSEGVYNAVIRSDFVEGKLFLKKNLRKTKLKCSSGIFLVLHLSYCEPPCSNIYIG